MHESFGEHEGYGVRDEGVFFHFSDAQSSSVRASFVGLSCHGVESSVGACVYFVGRVVFESLVKGGSDEDGHFVHASCDAVDHAFCAVASEPHAVEHVHESCGGVAVEGGGVLEPCVAPVLAFDAFHDLCAGHAARDGVWVHDNVGCDAVEREWHVFLWKDHADGAFLTGSAGVFVPDGGHAFGAESYFDGGRAAAFLVAENAVHDSGLGAQHGGVNVLCGAFFATFAHCFGLSDETVTLFDVLIDPRESVLPTSYLHLRLGSGLQ